jgi:hypothetical protein
VQHEKNNDRDPEQGWDQDKDASYDVGKHSVSTKIEQKNVMGIENSLQQDLSASSSRVAARNVLPYGSASQPP